MTVHPCPGCGQNCSDWFWNQETSRWDLGPLVIPCLSCRRRGSDTDTPSKEDDGVVSGRVLE
jgi:exonuclease I